MDSIDDLVAGLLATTPAADKVTPPAADDTNKGDTTGADGAADELTPGEPEGADDDADKSEDPADKSGDDADKGDGEDQDDADKADADTEPSYTVKNPDGTSTTVKLSEALAGYQRQSDYTRKTQEVAEQRKAVEAELATTRTQRGQYEAVLGELQRRLGPADGERTEVEWNELRTKDPAAYATEYTDFQRRGQQRATIKAEQDRIVEAKQVEARTALQTYVDGERTKLQAALPDMKDPVKGPKLMNDIRAFGRDALGFSDQELDRAYDSRVLILAEMAMKWSNHQKSLIAAKSKLDKAPVMAEPGAKQVVTPKGKKEAASKAAMKKLEKSGSLDDAAAFLLT